MKYLAFLFLLCGSAYGQCSNGQCMPVQYGQPNYGYQQSFGCQNGQCSPYGYSQGFYSNRQYGMGYTPQYQQRQQYAPSFTPYSPVNYSRQYNDGWGDGDYQVPYVAPQPGGRLDWYNY